MERAESRLTPQTPWPPGAHDLPFVHRADNPMTAAEAATAMAEVGVDRAVVVPPSFAGDSNDVIGAAVRSDPRRFVAFGRIPLGPARSTAEIEAEVQRSSLTGFRLAFNTPDLRRSLRGGEVDWLWRVCQELQLPVMVYAPGLVEELAQVAVRHDGLRLAVDHLNLSGVKADGTALRACVHDLLPLARFANVSVKASALPNNLPEGAPLIEVEPAVYDVVEHFGAGRVFWGSDLSRLAVAYRSWLDLFRTGLTALSDGERSLVLGGAIARWWSSTERRDLAAGMT